MSAIRVAIVEDDAPLRAAFTRLIDDADDMSCEGAFASAEEALDRLPASAPDVVLMDINLPGISGIECVRQLRAKNVDSQIVMLTTFDDATSVFESLKAGAAGYVLKRSPAPEILAAVRDVVAGGAPMSGAVARKVVQFFGQRGPAPEVESLTDREREVLVALSQGQQYKEVADTLGISINTVRKYIKAIYEKLHVNTRLDAISKLGKV
ncbi:MAG: response regulator transcription factor [Acidobacteriia bacterium]|nr:response regulator transcription factor [Terriglobia bacterium]